MRPAAAADAPVAPAAPLAAPTLAGPALAPPALTPVAVAPTPVAPSAAVPSLPGVAVPTPSTPASTPTVPSPPAIPTAPAIPTVAAIPDAPAILGAPTIPAAPTVPAPASTTAGAASTWSSDALDSTGEPAAGAMQFAPVDEKKPSKKPLLILLALVAVLAVGFGAFVVTRDGGERISDDVTLVPDTVADRPDASSFAMATAAAAEAGSSQIDMTVDTPTGTFVASVRADQASGRVSLELDVSDLDDPGGAIGPGTPMTFLMIVDQQTGDVYMESAVMGMFGVETPWILFAGADMGETADDDFSDIFIDPIEIADAFGDVEPELVAVETIDGEELTRYRVAPTADQMSDLHDSVFGGISDDKTERVVFDVWVTADDQIRRLAFDILADGVTNDIVLTLTTSPDAVEIALPDPADVSDLADLFEFDATLQQQPVDEFDAVEEGVFDEEFDDGLDDGVMEFDAEVSVELDG